ncbi:MAG: rhodanese-like domain-containing protein [archaeon]|nr:rhodanese-like domain-containing protein [archaeon]MDA1167528.1 rhodanese-like domain-containing protein [archaeon]
MSKVNTCSFFILLLLSTQLIGCTAETDEHWIRLDAEEFKTTLDAEAQAFLLDTRTQSEWENDGHLNGALLIPHDEIDARQEELPEDKGTLILLYCRSGNRSQAAAETLLDLGYTNIRDLQTGIQGWKAAGYPVDYGQ